MPTTGQLTTDLAAKLTRLDAAVARPPKGKGQRTDQVAAPDSPFAQHLRESRTSATKRAKISRPALTPAPRERSAAAARAATLADKSGQPFAADPSARALRSTPKALTDTRSHNPADAVNSRRDSDTNATTPQSSRGQGTDGPHGTDGKPKSKLERDDATTRQTATDQDQLAATTTPADATPADTLATAALQATLPATARDLNKLLLRVDSRGLIQGGSSSQTLSMANRLGLTSTPADATGLQPNNNAVTTTHAQGQVSQSANQVAAMPSWWWGFSGEANDQADGLSATATGEQPSPAAPVSTQTPSATSSAPALPASLLADMTPVAPRPLYQLLDSPRPAITQASLSGRSSIDGSSASPSTAAPAAAPSSQQNTPDNPDPNNQHRQQQSSRDSNASPIPHTNQQPSTATAATTAPHTPTPTPAPSSPDLHALQAQVDRAIVSAMRQLEAAGPGARLDAGTANRLGLAGDVLVRLNPESLGQMRVTIQRSKPPALSDPRASTSSSPRTNGASRSPSAQHSDTTDQTKVAIHVGTPEARDLLSASLADLAARMEARGLGQMNLAVELQPGLAQGSNQPPGDGRQPPSHDQRPSGHGGHGGTNPADQLQAPAPGSVRSGTQRLMVTPNGRLVAIA